MAGLRTLREHVESEGPLGVLDALGWITRAAKTLAIIHEQERVHGAVCADAIMLASSDCGAEGALAHPDDVAEAPEYHSRERATGGEPSRADDVWALCVTLFYAVTGALPFPRGVLLWLKADKRQPPPIAVYGADVAVMEVILGRLLDPRDSQRVMPAAIVLVLQLRGLSPRAGELPPLLLQEPEARPLKPAIPLPPPLPEIRMGEIIVVGPSLDGAAPGPSPALLASLPPAPMTPVEVEEVEGEDIDHRWRRRVLMAAVLGLVVGAVVISLILL